MNKNIIHVYNCNTQKAVELKTKAESEYWANLVSASENLSFKYPKIENYFKAIVKEPGTGYTFHVYFEDSDIEKKTRR